MDHHLDGRWVRQRIVDQAGLDGAQHARFVLRVQARRKHVDAERSQPGRLRGLVGRYRDFQAIGLE